MNRPFVLVAWIAAAALVIGACGVDLDDPVGPARTSTTAPTTTDDPPVTTTTAPGEAAVPDLRWRSCGEAVECAEVEVPLDHEAPDGPTTTLAVVRAPARQPDERVGAAVRQPRRVRGARPRAWPAASPAACPTTSATASTSSGSTHAASVAPTPCPAPTV